MSLTSSLALYETACEAALRLPGAEIYRFSARSQAEAARVAGKWFMVLAQVDGTQLVNLKAQPADVQAILRTQPEARAAWHMNKTHWYSLTPGPHLDSQLLAELITESYLTILESLPPAKRPDGWDSL